MGKELIDISNKRFGSWKVLSKDDHFMNKGKTFWNCICDCGVKKPVESRNLRLGKTMSCGCNSHINKIINLVGIRFAKLTVIKDSNLRSGSGSVLWECLCDCGNIINVAGATLKEGKTKSCGCGRKKPYGYSSAMNILNKYKKGAEQRGFCFDITDEYFFDLTQQNCYYCGIEPKQIMLNKYANGPYIYNGLDRVNNKQGYTKENVVPCCGKCNQMKSGFDKEAWIDHLRKIIKQEDERNG